MLDRLTRFDEHLRLEEHLRLIDETLERLARRIEALEARTGPQAAEFQEIAVTAEAPGRTGGRDQRSVLPALLGRTSLVFGGAFLLRALTESGHVPPAAGVFVGLLYALVWLAAANRTSGISATFHGATTLAIGLPIVWEAVLRFQTLSPASGAIALALVTGATIAVAWHRRLRPLAVLAVLSALTVALALMVGLREFVPFAILLLGIGAGGLALGYGRGWSGEAIVAAVVVDLVMGFAMVRAMGGSSPVLIGQLLLLQAAFVTVYLGTFLTHAIVRREPLGGFVFVQTAATIAFGVGGAVAASADRPGARLAIGMLSAAGAGLTYGLVISPRLQRHLSRSNSRFLTSTGLALAIVAGGLLIPAQSWPLTLAGAAFVLMWGGQRVHRPELAAHSVVVLLAGVALSRVPSLIAGAWINSTGAFPLPSMPSWLIIASAAGCLGVSRRYAPTRALAVVRVTIGAVVLAACGAILVSFVALPLAGLHVTNDLIPTIRTAVLAGLAMLAAWTARTWAGELTWLAYPLIAAGGLKLIVEDFRQSSPVLLFAGLTLYGVALIVVPRALDRRRRVSPRVNAGSAKSPHS